MTVGIVWALDGLGNCYGELDSTKIHLYHFPIVRISQLLVTS
jgi:hypothetical protein